MADEMLWLGLVGLIVAVVAVIWVRRSLREEVSQIGAEIKTTSTALQTLSNIITLEIGGEVKSTSAFVQGLRDLVTTVNQNVSPMMSGIKDMSVQLEKMDTLDKRAEETERVIKNLYSALAGSQSKGKMGEKALESIMAHLIKAGQVKTNQTIGGGRVEHAVVLDNDRMLPIDCKMAGSDEVVRLQDENLSSEDRSELVKEIRKKVRANIPEVQKYIQQSATLPMAVMAVPDGVMENVDDIVPEAQERNVILLGYSAVPQLIGYFMRIHAFYATKENIQTLQEKISWTRQELAKLDEPFFRRHFGTSLKNMEEGVQTIKGIVSQTKTALTVDSGPHPSSE